MIDVFRVKELDGPTEVYGIIAGDTTYTMSPYIHNAAFKSSGRNAVFVPFQVTDLDEFMTRMVQSRNARGRAEFSWIFCHQSSQTVDHQYLDEIDDAAKKIGAVNTIKIVDGKLHGYNTDAVGLSSH